MLALFFVAASASAVASPTPLGKVTLTPWCDNSMRVRVQPGGSLPRSAAAAQQALAKSLADKKMTDLAAALVTSSCTPGTAVHPTAGAMTTSGNLQTTVAADGTMKFTRADTGALLFSATPSFSYNGDAPSNPKPQGQWEAVYNKTVTCNAAEFEGTTGSSEDSADDCLAAAKASPMGKGKRIDYVIYNANTKGCYLCDMSDRGPYTGPASWGLTQHNHTVSWINPTPLPTQGKGYFAANLTIVAGNGDETIYGLGQGGWTPEGGCPADGAAGAQIVPLERNGQTINLQQRKFHVSIPYLTSTAGYGFLFNMPGYGAVSIGPHGVGGAEWSAKAALYLDFWVSALPATVAAPALAPIYAQYADATGHAPPLREDATVFWQSRNRYKSSAIALSVAERYQQLDLDVGVLVIDYKNQLVDGDFAPNPACYPSVSALSSGVRKMLNATLMFSFWPEVQPKSAEYAVLKQKGCLINPDLSGLAFDATIPECREFVWSTMLKPRYYDQGVDAFWLDETDGEGTAGGGDGDYGYNTSFGPAIAYSNLWVNDWISMYSDPVVAEPAQKQPPLVLTRGAWAGGQRYGTVLWSSDIHSSFEQLASMVPQGVHASMSGIPWWTTDVGGYGCGQSQLPTSPYMQELIVRWYQFGAFCPVFRTHGCRSGPSEPNTKECAPAQNSCGFNEIWSYGNSTQVMLEKMVRFRSEVLKPYIQELDRNVSSNGVPTMRPLAYEFPSDPKCRGINDQYMLGPKYLVAPVTTQGATTRVVYFPAGAEWVDVLGTDRTKVIAGGQTLTVDAPLDTIPVYSRK